MDRIRRIAMQMMEKHGSLFTEDFEKNKAILTKLAKIRSKQLRNRIAGFITLLVKQGRTSEKARAEVIVKEAEAML